MSIEFEDKRSKWLRDLIRFLPLKSQFVLSGNVRDLQIEDKLRPVVRSFTSYLNRELQAYGYAHVLSYDVVNGFKSLGLTAEHQNYGEIENLMKQLGLQPVNGCATADIALFEEVLEKIITWQGEPIALAERASLN